MCASAPVVVNAVDELEPARSTTSDVEVARALGAGGRRRGRVHPRARPRPGGGDRPPGRRRWRLPQLHVPSAGGCPHRLGDDRRAHGASARRRDVEPAIAAAGRSTAATVVVCCGSGGVGKTTVAAAIAIEAARRGRRAVVVTIDPARRLADALGLPDGLAATPQRRRLVRCAGRAVGDDARHAGRVRRRGAPLRRQRRAGGADRGQPVLPEHRRLAERHAGVHGGRDAVPAAPRRAFRPRRGRHAADPQRPRLPRGAGRARPLPRPPLVQADDAAGARRDAGASSAAAQPMLRLDRPGRGQPRCSPTPWRSSRRSPGWRAGSASGRKR